MSETGMKKIRTAVLISGSGSNLQALIDAAADPAWPAEIALVVSNKADAYGLTRAEEAGIATAVVNHRDYDSREDFDAALDATLREAGIELICLAGFMRILTREFTEAWKGWMLNIHPSLLPSFRGIHAQRQALEAGVKISGCTVHLVTPELDDGPILGQAAVPVKDGDTEETLSARILKAEHQLYPECVGKYAGWIRQYAE